MVHAYVFLFGVREWKFFSKNFLFLILLFAGVRLPSVPPHDNGNFFSSFECKNLNSKFLQDATAFS
jgi:hypothetical protein